MFSSKHNSLINSWIKTKLYFFNTITKNNLAMGTLILHRFDNANSIKWKSIRKTYKTWNWRWENYTSSIWKWKNRRLSKITVNYKRLSSIRSLSMPMNIKKIVAYLASVMDLSLLFYWSSSSPSSSSEESIYPPYKPTHNTKMTSASGAEQATSSTSTGS